MSSPPQPIGVLFVCMGNICRSPLAEAVFRAKITARPGNHRFHIDSAGTGNWHAGEKADHRMRRVAARHRIEMNGTARQVRRQDWTQFDHIICMDQENREDLIELGAPPDRIRLLLDFDPHTPLKEVPDPYHGEDDAFELVFRLVDSACDALLDELLNQHAQEGAGP